MPSLPTATHLYSPYPYSHPPPQLTHVHTYFHTNTHTHKRTQVQPVSNEKRLGGKLVREASGQWLHPPHPTHVRLSWTNEAMISGVFIHVTNVQIHKVRDTFFLHSVLITSEFSQPPRLGSPCVCGQQLHSGNRRDSRVCQNNGEWHRTGYRSGSRNLKLKREKKS